MMDVLGCQVTPAQFAQWQRYFVCDPAPYWLPRDLALPSRIRVLSREAFVRSDFELTYRDSYSAHAMSPDTESVAFLSPADFDALDTTAQQALLAAQLDLRRGHVYPWEQVARYIQSCQPLARTRALSRSGTTYLILDARLWWALPDSARDQWLIDWISHDARRCLSDTLSEADWSRLDHPAVRSLAGTFAARSGPNCFATTLAAILREGEGVAAAADQWLHQPEFIAALHHHGYQPVPSLSPESPNLYDSVLVWLDSNQQPQHACYWVRDGLALNKNAQAWFSPRQLLPVTAIIHDWSDTPYRVQVWQRPS